MVRWSWIWQNTARSVSFEANWRLLIGRRLAKSASAAFFGLGRTSASFQVWGKLPFWRERFNIRVMTGRSTSRLSTTKEVGMGSKLQVLLDLPIRPLTSSSLSSMKEVSWVGHDVYSGSVAVGQRFEAAVSSAVHLYFDDQKKEVVSPSFVAVFSKREIDSMLPCVTDDVKMSNKRKSGRWGDSRVCNWCFYHIYNWLLLWSITEQTYSNMESICCYNMESKCYRKRAFFISKFFNITRKSPFAQFGKQEESHLTWCIVFTKWAISLVVMRLQKSRHCHLNWAVAYREMNWKLTAKAELNCEIYQC